MAEWHEAAKVLDSKVGLRNLLRIHNCLSLDCYGELERMEDKNVPAYSIYHSMLIKWQQKESSDANLQELIQVLRQEDFEDAAVILEEYSKPYGVNSMLDVKWDFKACDHFTFLGAWDIAEETVLVQGGTELEYWRKVFVIQAQYAADLLPGKGRLEGRIPECWVGLNGKEHSIDGRFKVLAKVNPRFKYQWIQSDRLGEGIPIGSICGGITATGEKLYVGRAKIHLYGRWIHVPGKIFGSNLKTLYYPYHNKDRETNEFEVLVCTECSNLLQFAYLENVSKTSKS